MIVSFFIAGSLTTIGLIMSRGWGLAPSPMFNFNTMQVMFFMIGVSFIGFIASRYIFGISEIGNNQLLRSGAGYLGGLVILLFLLAVAVGLLWFNIPWLLNVLNVAFPYVLLLIGLEIFFSQILDFYRPRVSGEVLRPAFDSRLLSLLAAPGSVVKSINEAVNYQFGFEVTNSWFWQLLSKQALNLLAIGLLFLWGVSVLVVVDPQEQVLVSRFGSLVGEPKGPGLHFKMPWPIDQVERFNVTSSRQIVVGSHQSVADDQPILWTNRHAGGTAPPPGSPPNASNSNGEMLMMIAPPKSMLEDESRDRRGTGVLPLLTTDQLQGGTSMTDVRPPAIMLAGAEVLIQYRISDVLLYAKNTRESDRKLTQIADRLATRYLYRLDIDELIGDARASAAIELQKQFQQAADNEKLGLEILWVGLAGIHPAQQVADAFHETVGSRQERQTKIEQAQQEAVKLLVESAGGQDLAMRIISEIELLEKMKDGPDREVQSQRVEQMVLGANGQAAQRIAAARAERWQKANAERGRAGLFIAQIQSFDKSPSYFIARNYFNALVEGMAASRNKTYMIGEWNGVTYRPDLADQGGANNTIQINPTQ